MAPAFLPRILAPLMQAHPDLRLELSEEDNLSAQDRLLAGARDVILFAGQDLRRGVRTRHLLDLPPYVLAPEGHEIAQMDHVPLAELAQHPLVQLDRPLARPYVDGLFAARGLGPRIVARADSTEMVRSLVGAGAGLSVLAMRPLTGVSYGGDTLCARPLEPGLPHLQLLSGWAAQRPRRLITAFLDALGAWMDTPAARALIVGEAGAEDQSHHGP